MADSKKNKFLGGHLKWSEVGGGQENGLLNSKYLEIDFTFPPINLIFESVFCLDFQIWRAQFDPQGII